MVSIFVCIVRIYDLFSQQISSIHYSIFSYNHPTVHQLSRACLSYNQKFLSFSCLVIFCWMPTLLILCSQLLDVIVFFEKIVLGCLYLTCSYIPWDQLDLFQAQNQALLEQIQSSLWFWVNLDDTLWKTLVDIICTIRSFYFHGGCDSLVAKSCLTLATPWTAAHQVPLSMRFPRQEYWSGLPFLCH